MGLPQLKYNPGVRGDEELIEGFVVRHHHLELILEVLRENTGSSNQHLLIVGPRGSGKTTLVRCVAAEVRRAPEFEASWYPIVFAEESYLISSPGEFWLETLFHLGDQTQDERWDRAYQELREERDEARLRQRALAQLMDFAAESGKRVLLVVENMNMLLGEQMKGFGDWDLRHTLSNEPRVMLLGTATSRFEEVERIDKAWFELVAIHELQPLDAEECSALWGAVTGEEPRPIRLRPIQILTGGNPRLLRILAEFAAGRSFRELMSQLVHLIDEHTEYFKSHLDNLAARERKVFVSLLELWDPVSSKEVAQAARLGVSKTSSLLSRLVSRGAVQLVDQRGRRKIYQASERLFNIYYLMRRRGNPSGRVRAAVAFMVQFYQEKELVRATTRLAQEAYRLPSAQRQDHYWAYREIFARAPKAELLEDIVEGTPDGFLQAPDIPGPIRKFYERLRSPEEEGPSYSGAEDAYRKALEIDPDDFAAWAQLGQLLHEELERFDEAESAYRKAVEINDDYRWWAWAHLGQLLHQELERFDEAEGAYRKAVEINGDYAWAWAHLGQLLNEKLERYDEAENAFCKAVEIDPDHGWACGQLAGILTKLHRWRDVLEVIAPVLDDGADYEEAVDASTRIMSDLAAAGFAEEALQKLLDSRGAGALEPLAVGLQIFLGQDPKRAQEILEVGQDVAKRIRQRQVELAELQVPPQ